MAKVIEQVSIFISSPSDVNKEREAALKVINELNQTLCEKMGISLFPLTWENNTYPSVGDYSQDVINKQIGKYDIFVGIMANRFGTPTPQAGSGTEEEFNIAYENHENTQIMFFFKDKEVKPSMLDLEQYQIVKEFKKNLPKGVYYREFSEDFEGLFRKSLTQHLTDKYLKKMEEHNNDAKETNTKQFNSLFENYHNRLQEELSNISVLAVPNSLFKLKDIYVTQSLKKKELFESEKEVIKINRFPEKLIKRYNKILITDTAGMGKSTILKYMFLDLIENKINGVGIPIFIELNRLNKNNTILNEIHEELKLTKEIEKDLLLNYIQKGGFIFFLDGYDEISTADRIEVSKDIQDFISRIGTENYFIMTSRPEESLAYFRDFQSFIIQPLTKKEAFELLTKYDTSKQKKISKELIKELNTGIYECIDEYLENPLLASLLYTSFNFKAEIPLKKHQFYRQVFEALYSNHKLAQNQKPHEKHSKLDIDDFDRVLRYVGFDCLFRIGVQFDKDTILNSISMAKDFCGNMEFKESDLLNDLLISVPLFTRDGTGYKWAHKSLMEYFAARFIYCDAKENQDGILSEIYNSDHISKYINMLDLYYDIDPKGFSKNITLPFCDSYLKFYSKCKSQAPSNISDDLVNHRISLLFLGKYAFAISLKKKMKPELTKIFKENKLEEDCLYGKVNGKFIFMDYLFNYKINVLKRLFVIKNVKIFYFKERQISENRDLIIINSIKQNKAFVVDLKTGDNNDITYAAINEMFSFDIFIPDYQEFRKEVERINDEIAKIKKFSIFPKHPIK